MANIITCYKWVIDEADIKFDSSNEGIDTSRARSKISEYDRNAVEAGVMIGKSTGDTVAALTFGHSGARPSIKDVLSRGSAKAYWVNDELALTADGYVTAEVLAAAIRKIGDYKLIICAEGASDTYARQVGPRIGALLDIPVISSVVELNLEGSTITAKRKLEDVIEVVKTEAPAVICVLPEINRPPIPSLKQVVEASKKPVQEFKISDLGLESDSLAAKTSVKSLKAYTMIRKNIIIKGGSSDEKVDQLAAILRKEGVI